MSEQKYCTNCGAPLDESSRFCTKCGAQVGTNGVYGADGNFAGDQSFNASYQSAHEQHVQEDNKQSLSIASLVMGILSIFLPYLNLLLSVLAIVFGVKTKDTGYGKAGMILGIITLVLSIIVDALIIVAIVYALKNGVDSSGPWTEPSATVGMLTSLIG